MTHKNNRLRIARPTNRLNLIAQMYCKGLDFDVLGHFNNHQGFDGVIVGHPHHAYHLEFTHHRGLRFQMHQRRIICWCSILLMKPNGEQPAQKWSWLDFLWWFHITHIGINMVKRLPISMAIGLCYRILIGIDDFSFIKTYSAEN